MERTLAEHPGVALAAVVGAADWRLGEAVAAAVVLRPGWRWVGERCQVLLGRAGSGAAAAAAGQLSGETAARSALAAAAAAVGPPTRLALGGSSGSTSTGLPGEQTAEQDRRAAGGAVQYAEDLRSTLLQRAQRRPGSAEGLLSPAGSGGLDGAVVAPPEQGSEQELLQGGHLQQLMTLAAGLQLAARAAVAGGKGGARSTGGACSAGSQPGSGGKGRALDGRALQQHCRAVGLAGFKLPRVFLHCDAASAATPPAGSARAVLPVNSTGKVVKHLLRQAVQEHMAAAAAAAGGSSEGPRSRL